MNWKLRPLLHIWRKVAASWAEESPADPSNPGWANLSNSYITLQKTWRTVYMKSKKLARLEGWPAYPSHPFKRLGSPSYRAGLTFLHINTLARPAWSTRSRRNNQNIALLDRDKGSTFPLMQALATLIDSAGRVFHSLDGRTLNFLVILGFQPVLKEGKQGIKSYQSDFAKNRSLKRPWYFIRFYISAIINWA